MTAPLDREALIAFLQQRAEAARVDRPSGLLITAVLNGLVSRIQSGQFDLAEPAASATLSGLKPNTTYFIKATAHHAGELVATESYSAAARVDDGFCDWAIDDGDGERIDRMAHEFSGDGDVCVNCGTPKPVDTRSAAVKTFVEEILPEVPSSICEVGTCDLCGQEMLRTHKDCWHPWTVQEACPPTRQNANGLNVPEWGSPGRPGREHFREVNHAG